MSSRRAWRWAAWCGATLALISSRGIAADATTAIAEVGSEAIARDAVLDSIRPALDQLQREHDAQVRRLDFELAQKHANTIEAEVERRLNDRVLGLEGAASRASRAQLLSKVKAPTVSDAEVQSFYDANRQELGRPLEQVAKDIREFLTQQAKSNAEASYLRQLRAKYHAVSFVEPLRVTIADHGPARGPTAAPVTLVEFADFQCPYCGQMEPVLDELRATYPTQLRVVFRHLPLTSIHGFAMVAARASVCADRQGRFWDMHDALFGDQRALREDDLKATAIRIGLSGADFANCFADDSSSGAPVKADADEAAAIGVATTPTFFVNGRFLGGTQSTAAFKELIEDELARRKAAAATTAAR